MKYLIIILFFQIGFSQQISLNEVDEFTKTNIIQVNCSKSIKWSTSDNIAKGTFKYMFLSLNNYKYSDKTKDFSTLNLDITIGTLICLSSDSGSIILLLEDDSTITLNQTSKLDCAQRITAKYLINTERPKYINP